jgi:hypothetical protein
MKIVQQQRLSTARVIHEDVMTPSTPIGEYTAIYTGGGP